jgi:hypothetical protein
MLTALVLLLLCSPAQPARADIFYLRNGDKIDGEVVKEKRDSFRVRTVSGVVSIKKANIERVEKAPSPWERYDKKRGETADTADGHYELAEWCGKQGLDPEHRAHLKIAIAIDPNHAAARQALGYVLKDGSWIKARSTSAPSREALNAERKAKEEEQLVQKLVAQWFVKIKAIHRGNLANREPQSKDYRRGRDLVLRIDDPLAIPALTGVLSTGDIAARLLLVEALARFKEDEATMNLVVVALLDPAPEVRKQAAIELIPRKDDRVSRELREALTADEDIMVRNAASALGILKAPEAVEDLIRVLSFVERRPVEVTRAVMLDRVYIVFVRPSRHRHGSRAFLYVPNSIGVLGPDSLVGTESHLEMQTVAVYRTEVQEALIAITGQNFGFDGQAWQGWWRQQEGQNQPNRGQAH